MNKGVRAATSDFCQFLNSGDKLASNGVLEKIIKYLNSDVDILSGYTLIDKNNGNLIRNTKNSPDYMTKHFIIGCGLSHPSSFIRRELLLKYPYKENYKIISDWAFFVKVFSEDKAIYQHIDLDVVIFDDGGISSTNTSLVESERKLFLDEIKVSSLINEMAVVPFELLTLYHKIPYSDRLKVLLNGIVKNTINSYLQIRKLCKKEQFVVNTIYKESLKNFK